MSIKDDDLIPLSDRDLVVLRGARFDPAALTAALSPLGLHAVLIPRFDLVHTELKDLVVMRGVSYVWNLVDLREAVLPAAPVSERPPLLRMLAAMLERLKPADTMTVVDPYLLTSNRRASYIDDLLFLLRPLASAVTTLRLITGPNFESELLAGVRSSLLTSSPNCVLRHATTKRYHDRFWIADEARGLFVGTSLNSIGNRYALADYLRADDLIQIVKDLRQNGLLG